MDQKKTRGIRAVKFYAAAAGFREENQIQRLHKSFSLLIF
jgi:hypothetical protein